MRWTCLIGCLAWTVGVSADDVPSPPKSHIERIATTGHRYFLTLNGYLDFENSSTRTYTGWEVAFQPNILLAICNTGRTVIHNPEVRINDRGIWRDIDHILNTILRGAGSDQEKVYRIWQFIRSNRYHDKPVYETGKAGAELHDPVKMINIYGAGFCDDSGSCAASLFQRAGLGRQPGGKVPIVRTMHGHMMSEVFIDRDYQFIDVDEDTFFLDRDNLHPVSGDALARDHDLMRRERHCGPLFQGWEHAERMAALLGDDDGFVVRLESGHRMDFDLRPGERIEYRWEPIERYPSARPDITRRKWANARFVYRPPLDEELLNLSLESWEGFQPSAGPGGSRELVAEGKPGTLLLKISTPFVVCGGSITAIIPGAGESEILAEVSCDGQSWATMPFHLAGEQLRIDSLRKILRTEESPPIYDYFVRVTVHPRAGQAVHVRDLLSETAVLVNPIVLPRLSLGRNAITYRDETEGSRSVAVVHVWRECTSTSPPPAPAGEFRPAGGSVVRDSVVTFSWPAVEGCTRYHLLLTLSPETHIPYRPDFDTILEAVEFTVPFTGILRPDTTYYWRVRAQNQDGIWSRWSPIHSIQWQGPCVPKNLRFTTDGQRITLFWEPNPHGTQPVRYKVYGSDEKGFSVNDHPYRVWGLGDRPANLLGETTECRMVVVSPETCHPAMNRVFYRVVAVDANGVEGGCSDYVELPHPFVVSERTLAVVPGEGFSHRIRSLQSIGDLQHDRERRERGWFDIEELDYELLEGPGWLLLQKETGELSGMVPSNFTGSASAKILVSSNAGTAATHTVTLKVED